MFIEFYEVFIFKVIGIILKGMRNINLFKIWYLVFDFMFIFDIVLFMCVGWFLDWFDC